MREEAFIKVQGGPIQEKVNEFYAKVKRVCQLRTFHQLHNHYLQHKNSKFLGIFTRNPITFHEYVEKEHKKWSRTSLGFTDTIWWQCKDTTSYDGFCEEINLLVKHASSNEIYLGNEFVSYLHKLETKAGYLKDWELKLKDIVETEKEAFDFIAEHLYV